MCGYESDKYGQGGSLSANSGASLAINTQRNDHQLDFVDGGFVLDGKPVVARRRGTTLRVGCTYVSGTAWDELKALMNGEAR